MAVNIQYKESALAALARELPRLLLQFGTAKLQLDYKKEESKAHREFTKTENDKTRQSDNDKFNLQQISKHGVANLKKNERGLYETVPMSEYKTEESPELAIEDAQKKQELIFDASKKYPNLNWSGDPDEDFQLYGYVSAGFEHGKNKATSGVLSNIPYIAAGTIDIAPGISDQRDLDYLDEYFRNSGIFLKEYTPDEEAEYVARDIGLMGEGESYKDAKGKLKARWAGFKSGVIESGKLMAASDYDKFQMDRISTAGTASDQLLQTSKYANSEWEKFTSSIEQRLAPVENTIMYSVGGKPYDIATEKGRKRMIKSGYPATSQVIGMLADSQFTIEPAIRRLMQNQTIMGKLRSENPALFSELSVAMENRRLIDEAVVKSRDVVEGFEPTTESYQTQLISADNFQSFLIDTRIPDIARSLLGSRIDPKKRKELVNQMAEEIIKAGGKEGPWQAYIHEYLTNLESVMNLGE